MPKAAQASVNSDRALDRVWPQARKAGGDHPEPPEERATWHRIIALNRTQRLRRCREFLMQPVDEKRTSAPTTSHLREQAADIGAQAEEKLADAARPLESKARGLVDQQKDASADRLSKVGDAAQGAAQTLEGDMPQLAGYIRSAAERLQDASNSLRTGNVEDLVDRYNTFSRKQPAMAFAGAVLAGLALSRFLKSSTPRAQS